MATQDQRIREEAVALWVRLYTEPPPQGADGQTLLGMIHQRLPDTSYGRLNTPHLRPAAIVFPEG